MNQQTEQAHQALRNLLLNGRILINGFPPTAAEMSGVIQAEQMLYEKAAKLDKANQLVADKKKPPQGKVIPIDSGKKKKE